MMNNLITNNVVARESNWAIDKTVTIYILNCRLKVPRLSEAIYQNAAICQHIENKVHFVLNAILIGSQDSKRKD